LFINKNGGKYMERKRERDKQTESIKTGVSEEAQEEMQ
jgi:hypothetical protein